MKSYVVGFDLGGTKVLATLFDRRFRVVAEIKAKSKPQKGQKYFLKTITECFDYLMHEGGVKRSDLAGIGIGCPGIIDERRGVVLTSPNISFMKNFRLADRLKAECRVPVAIGNDVNIGLFGEHQFGAAKGYSHVVGIFIGTGIGGAMIINGQLYAGAGGGAGEIGHVQIIPHGPICGCGRRGCFEAVCSRLSIATEAAVIAARQQAPHLLESTGTDILDIKSGELAQAIRSGDRVIERLVRRKAGMIGSVMASMVNLLNPEMIVLGGGMVEAMPNLVVKEATHTMMEQAMAPLVRKVKVAPARLGDRAIVMGAAKLAWDRFGESN